MITFLIIRVVQLFGHVAYPQIFVLVVFAVNKGTRLDRAKRFLGCCAEENGIDHFPIYNCLVEDTLSDFREIPFDNCKVLVYLFRTHTSPSVK